MARPAEIFILLLIILGLLWQFSSIHGRACVVRVHAKNPGVGPGSYRFDLLEGCQIKQGENEWRNVE